MIFPDTHFDRIDSLHHDHLSTAFYHGLHLGEGEEEPHGLDGLRGVAHVPLHLPQEAVFAKEVRVVVRAPQVQGLPLGEGGSPAGGQEAA